MLDFPYMGLPGGITRPIIAVLIEGPGGTRLLDALVDSGCDRTIIPQREAKALGIQLPLTADGSIKTAGGLVIEYRLADAVFELRSAGAMVRWKTAVAFAADPLSLIHLGTRGFLQYFHCLLLGPEERVQLDPRPLLPSVGP
jgi:hypothetical protein